MINLTRASWITILAFVLVSQSLGQNISERRGNWGPFVEQDFPFFSSVLDLRKIAETNNITPRGLVLNAGHDFWVCFDTELLRVSAIWKGKGLTPVSMSQGSYFVPGIKAPEGQAKLPAPDGEVWLWNGLYLGWQTSPEPLLDDPRPPGPDSREVGRGPLPESIGRFRAIRCTDAAALEYEVSGISVQEMITASGEGVQRTLTIAPHTDPLSLVIGRTDRPVNLFADETIAELRKHPDGTHLLQVKPSRKSVTLSVVLGAETRMSVASARGKTRWPGIISTKGVLSTGSPAFVTDNIGLPSENPWKRNMRIADLAFFRDGRAAVVTFDGDVWTIKGLQGDLGQIQWKRFTSGLHEPLAIAIRNDEIFVFDRNGIWRLQDSDHDGEADTHELFSNAFTQTAETREFCSGMRVAPDGSFVIAKGGQQSATVGQHNGSVLRISPDGRSATVLAHGLRQPFIGVHPQTGLITASDQQGHYIPATPLHIIRENSYYGFIPTFLPKERYPEPIADPLTWIPHPVNASGVSQVWLAGAKMGPLNDALIHLGYYRPEIFLVLLNGRTTRTQAVVISITRDLRFPPLAGAVNPVDGQLYVAGFQIWGTTAKQVSGIARLRYTGRADALPRQIVPMDQGILIRFNHPVDPAAATNPANFSAERWNYLRTAEYGSPHFKMDRTKGQDPMPISSAYVSRDRKSVFVGIPDMKPVMQMRFAWALSGPGQNAYFTVYKPARFDARAEGFDALEVDLTPRPAQASEQTPVTAEEGERLAELMGCVACHSTDGSVLGKVAPTWKGLYRSERRFIGGIQAIADEAYLRESIREPAVKIVSGFEKSDTGMPSYEGVLTPDQIEALILYIKSLSPQ